MSGGARLFMDVGLGHGTALGWVVRIRGPHSMPKFDRAEDLGNSIHLEHVNVRVPDQHLATLFYVTGLGLTRDPYLMTSDDNMWVNVGRSQFHLPSGKAQVLRGHIGLVIWGRKALLDRLASIAHKLRGTAFAFREHNDHVEATCPWGNRMRCFEPDARAGRITSEPMSSSRCRRAPQCHLRVLPKDHGNAGRADATVASVKTARTSISFQETDRAAEYDGHHVQIYITNFPAPIVRCRARPRLSRG